VRDFKEKYGFKNVLGTLLGNGIAHSNYDYIELHSIYEDQLRNITNYLKDMTDISSSFRSTQNNRSFGDLRAKVQSISDYDLNKFEIYIYEKGVTKNDSVVSAVTYIDEKIKELDRDIASTEAAIVATNTAIEKFVFVYNTTYADNNATTQVLANGKAYDKLQEEAMRYQAKLVGLNSSKALWESRNDKVESAVAMTEEEKAVAVATAESMLVEMDTNLKIQIGYVDQTVNEYIESEVMKNSIFKSLSAVKAERENDSWKVLAIAELLVMFFAAIAAIMVTRAKENKQMETARDIKQEDKD
jgi:tetrahydromethanopterin S-methyltransferase subunit B